MTGVEAARLVLTAARERGRTSLTEPEAMEVFDALGIATPRRVLVSGPREALEADLAGLGPRVVVKVVAPGIVHKTEVGGVAVVPNEPHGVAAAIAEMAARLEGAAVEGYAVCEFVEHESGLGGELLVGLRWTDDFGPVAAVGAGGVHAEFLASCFAEGRAPLLVATLVPS